MDNEQSDQTADMVAAFAGKVTGQWGTTVTTSPVTKNVWFMRRRPRTWVVRAVSPPACQSLRAAPHGSGVMDDDGRAAGPPLLLSKWTDKHEVIRGPDSTTMAARSTGSTTSLYRWASRTRIAARRIRPGRIPSDGHAVLRRRPVQPPCGYGNQSAGPRASSSTGMTRCMATAQQGHQPDCGARRDPAPYARNR